MSSPPVAKRARLELDDIDAQNNVFDQAEQLQAELEQINDEASEKILEIEREYNRKRRPKYESRSKLLRSIPKFWQRVLSNSAIVSSLLTEDDIKALEYLEEVDVEDFDDIKSGYRIVFRFRDNPWFAEGALEKTFRFDEEGQLSVSATTPAWKPNMCLTADADLGAEEAEDRQEARNKGEWVSFFDWFRSDEGSEEGTEASADVVAKVIKDEMWPDPLRYYRDVVNDDQGYVEVDVADGDEEGDYLEGGEGQYDGIEEEEEEDDDEGEEGYEEGDGGEEEFALDEDEEPS